MLKKFKKQVKYKRGSVQSILEPAMVEARLEAVKQQRRKRIKKYNKRYE